MGERTKRLAGFPDLDSHINCILRCATMGRKYQQVSEMYSGKQFN